MCVKECVDNTHLLTHSCSTSTN